MKQNEGQEFLYNQNCYRELGRGVRRWYLIYFFPLLVLSEGEFSFLGALLALHLFISIYSHIFFFIHLLKSSV